MYLTGFSWESSHYEIWGNKGFIIGIRPYTVVGGVGEEKVQVGAGGQRAATN